nr:probable aspartyl protease At4g16563 [Tanacetum cinerariifolium]
MLTLLLLHLSRACSFVHNHIPSSHLCAMSRCPLDSIEMSECQNYMCPSFYYAYGDGSFVGKLYEDVLELPMSAPPSLTVENITFSCAHEALSELVDVAGFGRLEAVTVGKKRITAPLNLSTIDGKGNGGMVVDSGTTYSVLPEDLYNSVMGEFGRLVKSGYKRAQEVVDKTGLSPCYYTERRVGGTDIKKLKKYQYRS